MTSAGIMAKLLRVGSNHVGVGRSCVFDVDERVNVVERVITFIDHFQA